LADGLDSTIKTGDLSVNLRIQENSQWNDHCFVLQHCYCSIHVFESLLLSFLLLKKTYVFQTIQIIERDVGHLYWPSALLRKFALRSSENVDSTKVTLSFGQATSLTSIDPLNHSTPQQSGISSILTQLSLTEVASIPVQGEYEARQVASLESAVFSIKIPGYNWSERMTLQLDSKEPQSCVIVDKQKRPLRLLFDVIETEVGHKVFVYTLFWIINRTGLPFALKCKTENAFRHFELEGKATEVFIFYLFLFEVLISLFCR